MPKGPLKVAILGHASGKEQAPFDNATYEKWAVNDAYLCLMPAQLATVTRWFELHRNTPLTRTRRPPQHWRRLDRLRIPVYTLFDPPSPMSEELVRHLPIEALISQGADYFASTLAYQIALALSENASHIELYGTPLIGAREALVERPCVEWWLGLATGRGVTVRVVHDQPEGLCRHVGHYAEDDEAERLGTSRYVYHHTVASVGWLIDEAQRLPLMPPKRARVRRCVN